MKTFLFSQFAFGDLPLRVDWHKKTSESLQMHAHDFFEMIFIVSGKGIHEVKSKCFEMRPGDVFLVPPYTPHCYRKRQNAEIINLIFDHTGIPSWQPELFPDTCRLFRIIDGKFNVGQIHLDGDNRNQIGRAS
ncbi:MAG: AraC family ligand binding domain-containing protein, partial [Victivallales bacterium]|nr:AraC family ligand binding domain-containing protein [Victivallales bacterium]